MKSIINIFKKLFQSISSKYKVFRFYYSWRKKNQHNFTTNKTLTPDIIEVGNSTYGRINVKFYGNQNAKVKIGHFCSIAEDTWFLSGGEHELNCFSTFPFDYYYNTEHDHVDLFRGPIVVGDDVWIGHGVTILSGVTIGQGAVIGAKSVVAKDVPPYAIYVGNKVIKYRYKDEYIEKMLKFDFAKLTKEDIEKNGDILHQKIDDSFFETDFYKNHLK